MKGVLISGGICLLSISFIVGFYLISVLPVQAAINSQIPFYGTLQDSSGNNLSGTYDMVFRFYDAASGGTLLDTSTHTAANSNAVTVTNGEFNVMLGSGTGNALDGLDFDTSNIYVGLTVEGDAEMTPRERLGAAGYAFNSDTVDGYDADQLLRYNATGSISATDSATLFTITQGGAGDIFNVFDSATEVFTILDGGNVGVGSSTPLHTFSVDGDVYASGALYDNNNSAGTSGYVLQSNGTGFNWVATSTLGLGGGASTLDSLSDVDTTGVVSGNILAYNGSQWVDFATSTFLMESELNTFSELDTLVADKSIANLNDAQTFAGLLTMTGGLISNSSSTLANLNFTTATGTTLVLGGDTITDFTGTGLVMSGTQLTTTLGTSIDESELNIAGSPTNGYLLQASSTATGGFAWVATSTLGLGGGGGGSLFTDGGATTYLTATGDNLGIGTTSANAKLTVSGNINIDNVTSALQFMGTRYLYASTTNDSLVFGEGAGATFNSLTTYNLAFGFGAGQYASTTFSDNNVLIGRLAGQNNTSGSNVIIGYTAGQNNTDYGNIIIGEEAGQNNTGNSSVMLGWRAGQNNTAYSTMIIGEEAGQYNTGMLNNLIGYRAGQSNTGERNTITGYNAGLGNTGDNNFIFGYFAGNTNSGDHNMLLGQAAGEQNTGSDNFIVGQAAGDRNSGNYNNIFGQRAGVWNTGNFNNFIGYEAGGYLQSTSSVIVGSEAFRGSYTINPEIELYAVGVYTALNNTALGYGAGRNATSGANNNIFVGYQAADNVTTGANNIVLGYDVDLQSPTQSNTLNIGNIIFGTGLNGTGTNISSGNIGIGTSSLAQKLTVAGDIRVGSSTGLGCIEDFDGTLIGGTCFSDESLKTNIAALTEYSEGSILENLVALTPVTYNWNTEAAENLLKNQTVVNVGLIAQDVEESFPELIIQQGDIKQVRFASLQFYIIQAIKEMWEVVTGNQKRITELENRLNELESQLGVKSKPSNVSAPESTSDEEDVASDVDDDVSIPAETEVLEPEINDEVAPDEEVDSEVIIEETTAEAAAIEPQEDSTSDQNDEITTE